MESGSRERQLVQRLRRRKLRHLERSRLYRGVFGFAGFALLAAGLAMLVLPGPGLLVAAIGLAMLALEFAWAEKTLLWAVRRFEGARGAPDGSRFGAAVRAVAFALVALALVAVVLVWDVPLLPV